MLVDHLPCSYDYRHQFAAFISNEYIQRQQVDYVQFPRDFVDQDWCFFEPANGIYYVLAVKKTHTLNEEENIHKKQSANIR